LYFNVKVKGTPLSAAVGSWFFTPTPVRYVDSCDSVNCNPSCTSGKFNELIINH